MIAFEIQDMTCGHCRAAITQAVLGVDSAAEVEVDLAQRRVRIDSAETDPRRFGAAITAAGYTAAQTGSWVETAATSRTGGCGCSTGKACCRT